MGLKVKIVQASVALMKHEAGLTKVIVAVGEDGSVYEFRSSEMKWRRLPDVLEEEKPVSIANNK